MYKKQFYEHCWIIHGLEWNGDMPLNTEDFRYATKGDHVGNLTNVTDESDIVCTPFMGLAGGIEYPHIW